MQLKPINQQVVAVVGASSGIGWMKETLVPSGLHFSDSGTRPAIEPLAMSSIVSCGADWAEAAETRSKASANLRNMELS